MRKTDDAYNNIMTNIHRTDHRNRIESRYRQACERPDIKKTLGSPPVKCGTSCKSFKVCKGASGLGCSKLVQCFSLMSTRLNFRMAIDASECEEDLDNRF